jgi:hypothetical protein
LTVATTIVGGSAGTVSLMRRVLSIIMPIAVLLAACGDGEPTAAAPPTPEELLGTTIVPIDLDGDLPPVDAIHADAIIGADLAALGLRLTNRGGLIDRSDNGYDKSVTGTHYALYVEPILDSYTIDDFAVNLVALTKATAPVLFDRYPGLESYDICQEPRSIDDNALYPPPVTQIELDRGQVESIDWETFDLATLFAQRDTGGTVRISPSVAVHPSLAEYAQD